MKRFVSFFIVMVVWLLPLRAQMGHFYPSERFSSGLVSRVCQDSYGYVWVGTEYGLNRFDGYRFMSYLHRQHEEGSLGNNDVSSMLCDREGRFWVGTAKGLDRYDYTTGRFVHYAFEGNVRPRVTCIAECRAGNLYVATAGYGLFRLDDGQLRRVADGLTTPDEIRFFNVFMCDSKGRFWKCGFSDVVTMRKPDGTTVRMVSPFS